jgi:hypothetical protein
MGYIGEYKGPTPTYGTYYRENNNANDTFGHANLTDHNITYITNGRFGSHAASFNGTSSYQDNATGTTCQRVTFTWMAWVYNNRHTGAYQTCLNLAGGTSYYGWAIRGDNGGTGKVMMYYANNAGGSPPSILSTNAIPANQWAHIAVTISDATNSAWAMYLNGEPNGSGTLTGRLGYSGTHTIQVGDFYNGPGGSTRTYYYNGYMDEVMFIGDTAWTAAQIKKYYAWSVGKYEAYTGTEC